MTGGLPQGLVATTDAIGIEIENVDRVQPEELAHLWRVYATNSALLENNAGDRLRNLFWRIWSNPNINRYIRGETVARLFLSFSTGGDRPTPTHSTPAVSPSSTAFSGAEVADSSSPPAGQDVQDIPSTLPPSILKKSRLISDDLAATSRVSGSTLNETDPSTRAESSSSILSTLSPPSPRPVVRSPGLGVGKKRTSFAAGATPRSKIRPSLARRSSSRGSSSNSLEQRKNPRPCSQKPPEPPDAVIQGRAAGEATKIAAQEAPGLPNPTSEVTSPLALPSAESWQDVVSLGFSRDPFVKSDTPEKPGSWLVDKNFRGNFVENQKQAASHTNLAKLGRTGSTVRFMDDVLGSTKAKEPVRRLPYEIEHETKYDDTGDADCERHYASSLFPPAGLTDDNKDEIGPISRTKSQLSMMIEHERRMSGAQNLGPDPVVGPNPLGDRQQSVHTRRQDRSKGKGLSKEDGGSSEEDLLVMGKRTGQAAKGVKKQKPGSPSLQFMNTTPPLF